MNVYLKRWDSDALQVTQKGRFTVDLSSIQFQHTHTQNKTIDGPVPPDASLLMAA